MKRFISLIFILIIFTSAAFGYKLRYAEEFYNLYHKDFYPTTENCFDNILYLEAALDADFANPLNALAKIENEIEWEKYRYLFYTHVCLRMVDTYLTLGAGYDKQHAYFYNQPWKEENLASLDLAEEVYNYALVYWDEAVYWSEKAQQFPYIFLDEIQYWNDESYRISTGDLNYESIIQSHLDHLEAVRQAFLEMDENTY